MSKQDKGLGAPQALRHADHKRPVTRREFLAQGFVAGSATLLGPTLFGLFADPRAAQAALSSDLEALKSSCGIAIQGAGKIPFICFDLAGGASMTGSNVLVGGQGGQMNFLSTAGYNRQGLPGDMVPGLTEAAPSATSNGDHTDTSLGLAFHSDSAFLRGIMNKAALGTIANINGAVIPARSDNDTANNPHNPMYGIHRAGADGALLTLIGSRSTDSGGNSIAPVAMVDPAVRPTKVDRPSDVTGLVDTGKLVGLLSQSDAVAVMESIYRISDARLGTLDTKVTTDAVIKDLVRCGYVKSADLADRFGDPTALNPSIDPQIVGAAGIFSQAEYDNDSEYRMTASVMKLVVNGYAGAGTVTFGGCDYHTGNRSVGELRDEKIGRCIGACLEYAARVGNPLMIYVCSDGSIDSNGAIDNTVAGRGKGVWTGDNSSTAASFFLVYNPAGRPQLMGGTVQEQAIHQQIGYMRTDGSVETSATPASNNVNLLVETVVLNYMALHGEQGNFATAFPTHGLGNVALRDSLTAFQPICNGTIA